MITGIHAMFYSPKAAELREFFRDKIGLSHVDAGEGWLIFRPLEGELGFHENEESKPDISLYCDDIQATVTDLKSRGVEFEGDIENHGYGLVTFFNAPGDLTIQLYQALYNK